MYARVVVRVDWTQWEPVNIQDLRLVLVMVLDHNDFNKEIDRTYEQVGIALAIGAPIAVTLTAFSTCLGMVAWSSSSFVCPPKPCHHAAALC